MGLMSTVKDTVKDAIETVKELPYRRPDGDMVKNIHPYRRMLWYPDRKYFLLGKELPDMLLAESDTQA